MKLRPFHQGKSLSIFCKQYPTGRASVYGDHAEYKNHQRYIEVLAEAAGRPSYVIVPMYERVLAELRPHAKVTDYLPILVSKHVMKMLKV
jgi:hypothetical protein